MLLAEPTPALGEQTTRASVGASGVEGNNDSDNGSISATGRFVVFQSNCTNFDPAETLSATTDVCVAPLERLQRARARGLALAAHRQDDGKGRNPDGHLHQQVDLDAHVTHPDQPSP